MPVVHVYICQTSETHKTPGTPWPAPPVHYSHLATPGATVDIFETFEIGQFIPTSVSNSESDGFIISEDLSMTVLQLLVELFIDMFCIGIKFNLSERKSELESLSCPIPCYIPMALHSDFFVAVSETT